jgi:hypothetical protein
MMGPAERQLRESVPNLHWYVFGAGLRAAALLRGAAEGLGFESLGAAWDGCALQDVWSEAIEAAEALGL